MKIILSPSKTQDISTHPLLEDKELLFPKEHKKLLAQLRKLTKKDIGKIMNIKGDLLHQTYTQIKQYNTNETGHAFPSFNGLVFKGLELDTYQETELDYMKEHVRILDAFYGVLEPGTRIKPYRLDMKMNIGVKLYQFWNIDAYFEGEDIINLASDEFSNMLAIPMINISFLQQKNGTFINQATYSKQARGKMLNYMILNHITHIEDIKKFNQENYTFNQDLSDHANIVFTR